MGRMNYCYSRIGTFAFLAIAVAGCGSSTNPPQPTHALSPNPIGQAIPNADAATPHYSYDEISKPFLDDLSAANRTFAGRIIEVGGSADTGFAMNGFVNFQSPDEKSPLSKRSCSVVCELADKADAKTIANHEAVTVRGTFVGAFDSGGVIITLKNCSIVRGAPSSGPKLVIDHAPPPAAAEQSGPKTIRPRTTIQTSWDSSDIFGINGLAITPNGKRLVVHGGRDIVQIWDIDQKQKLYEFKDAGDPLAISPDGTLAVFFGRANAGKPQRWRLVEIASGKEVRNLNNDIGVSMMGMQFTPRGGSIVAAGIDQIVSWDVNSGDQRFKWKQEGEINSLSNFFDGGKKIASVCKQRTIAVWGGNTGKPIRTFDVDGKEKIVRLAVSNDGTTLVTKESIGRIQVWDFASGHLLRELEASAGIYSGLSFLPDSKTVVFSSRGLEPAFTAPRHEIVCLANANTGATTCVFDGHKSEIRSFALTSDGRTLIAAGKDGSVLVWDVPAQ